MTDAELFELGARWAKQCGRTSAAIAWRKVSARRWRRTGMVSLLVVAALCAPLVVVTAIEGYLWSLVTLVWVHWLAYEAAGCWGNAEQHENDILVLEATP